MFHCGYCNLIVHDDVLSFGKVVEDMKSQCEKVILGIPDNLTFARLYGDLPYSAEEKKIELLNGTHVDDVLIIGDRSGYRQVYEKIHYDNLYYGSHFGKAFDDFIEFAKSKKIHMSSMLPDSFIPAGLVDALKIALGNLQQHQKIILFGTGHYFDLYMETYGRKYIPAYAVDNDTKKQGLNKNGINIYSPDILNTEKTDDILIIICTKKTRDIIYQIKELGDFDYRTLIYNNTIALLEEYYFARIQELDYLEKAQAILAEMLREFDRVCQKHNLHYYMICGSLIGVVRHKGFIPWDDDVDVAMPREDYELLKEIAKIEWGNTQYRILGYEQIGKGVFLDCMPRFICMNERLPMKVFDKVKNRIPNELFNRPFIDIYVLDNAFDNDKKHMFTMKEMKFVYNLLMGHRGNIDYDEYRARISPITIWAMRISHKIGRCLPFSVLISWYDHLSKKANRSSTESYFMPSCAITCIERKFKQRLFGEEQRMPFLDFEVSVPSDIDGIMEAMGYHGYMQFPRMTIRKPSHYFNSDIIIW